MSVRYESPPVLRSFCVLVQMATLSLVLRSLALEANTVSSNASEPAFEKMSGDDGEDDIEGDD